MLPDKLLLRAAGRLLEVWHKAAASVSQQLDPGLDRIAQTQVCLQQVRRRLDKARRLRLALVQPQLEQEIIGLLRDLCEDCNQLLTQLEKPPPTVPPIDFLREELRQVALDFEELTIDWKTKAVIAQTEPITLDHIYLGPFEVHFCWQRLLEAQGHLCFNVVALEPNPSVVDESVTHPHVKDELICAGDATSSIKNAVQQGRLADAFGLMRSVLLTYNARSPYVALSRWQDDATCSNCGSSVGEGELSYCEGCESDFCDECTTYCARCDCLRCEICLQRCAVCESWCCRGCLEETAASQRSCCSACLRNCPECLADFAVDEQSPGSELCPACRKATAASVDEAGTVPVANAFGASFSQESFHATSVESSALARSPA
jgi:hypothetical protein